MMTDLVDDWPALYSHNYPGDGPAEYRVRLELWCSAHGWQVVLGDRQFDARCARLLYNPRHRCPGTCPAKELWPNYFTEPAHSLTGRRWPFFDHPVLLRRSGRHGAYAMLSQPYLDAGATVESWQWQDDRYPGQALVAVRRPGAGPYASNTATILVEAI